MKMQFIVKPLNGKFDVIIMADSRAVSVTTFNTIQQIEFASAELLAKATDSAVQALAIENSLNAMLHKMY